MKKKALFILILMVTTGILFIVQKTDVKKETEVVQWNSPNENMTIPFITGKSGHLFFKASINGVTGLFLFDTGAENSFLNEKYITGNDLKLDSCSIIDAHNIRQTKNLYKIRDFKLGAIQIKELVVYPADTLMWKDSKGFFYKHDSVIGVIGTNIISKFIWDFDMVHKRVTVSNSSSYCDSLPDSSAVKLVSVEKHKEIVLYINGKPKRLTLDFGSRFPVILAGSIPNTKESKEIGGYFMKTYGAWNHLDSIQRNDSKFDFVDVKLGTFDFKEIQCFERDGSNLLGIPFVWSFKRVVIEFIHDRAYFIALNENGGDFAALKYNRQSVWTSDGEKILNCKPEGMPLIFTNSSGRVKYVGYGKLVVYNHNNQMDSIHCIDSIRLPDGKIKLGPVTLKTDSMNKGHKIN